MKKINKILSDSYIKVLESKSKIKPEFEQNNITLIIENIRKCFKEFSDKESSGCLDCDSPGCIDCEKLGITTHELEVLYNIYARTKNSSSSN